MSYDQNLEQIFADAARQFPKRICIDFMDKTYSYAEVARLVDKAACGLQAMGVKKGDRVGLLLPNTPYFIIFYYAILKVGAVVVNLNPLYAEAELEHLIEDSGLQIAVTLDLKLVYDKLAKIKNKMDSRFRGNDSQENAAPCLEKIIVCPLAECLPPLKKLFFPYLKAKEIAHPPHDESHVFYGQLIQNNGCVNVPEINPREDIAVLQYTGGTTGIPKAAMLTHANLVANTLQCRAWFAGAKEGEEVLLAVLPFFHVFAMTVAMNLAIKLGASIVMLPRFELEPVIRTIHRKKPSLLPAVPTIFAAIANFRGLKRYDISSVKYCISGGAGLPMDVKKAFEAVTGCVVVEGYGLTESSPVATCNPLEGVNKAGSIGLPLPRTKIEIVNPEDKQTIMPQGERGEVCIRGPQVMKGYWKNKAETDNVLRPTGEGDMRLFTGDIGKIDEDGYIYIVDRIKDLILCSGYNVYPRNVEDAIYKHDAVAECVVGGVTDLYRGQTVKAWIALKAGTSLTRDELLEFLKDKLSPIEMPKHVEFRDVLPKTLVGKLSRKDLMEEEARKKAKNA